MDTICDQNSCTGCQACKSVCPKSAIEMVENERGFVYPLVNKDLCIDCNLCQKVCPSINPVKKNPKQNTIYACWIKDSKNRKYSTSGGMGYIFSKWILEQNGVYCGCRWNIDHAEHVCCENHEELYQFQGSKYTYSDIGDSFKKIKDYLKQNRKVLFTGTPCQVAGLKSFLRTEYENLFTVELICHGYPSPLMLRKRIEQIELETGKKLIDLRFRHKVKNQHFTCMKYTFEDGTDYQCTEFKDLFSRGFDGNYFLRENCFNCKYSTPERIADLTIADFWGYYPKSLKYFNHLEGTSLVITNSSKGFDLFEALKDRIVIDERTFDEASKGNPNLLHPQLKPELYEDFWDKYAEGEDLSRLQEKYFPPIKEWRYSRKNRMKLFLRLLLKQLLCK